MWTIFKIFWYRGQAIISVLYMKSVINENIRHKTLVWYVLLQVGMKYGGITSCFIALLQIVLFTSALAVSWFEQVLKVPCFHRDFV